MRINKKQFNKWIEALDSGEYKQTKGVLQDKKGFCCLGVGCVVLIPKIKLKKDGEGFITGAMPDDQKASPIWLQDINLDFNERAEGHSQLTELNDDKQFTFTEIATMLELVYIHKAFN